MATMKETGLDEKTLVFFISDNGGEPPVLGTHNGPHRGIARWPGRIPNSNTFEPMVHIMDVFSTSLAAAGIPLPRNVDGVNLLPHLTGEKRIRRTRGSAGFTTTTSNGGSPDAIPIRHDRSAPSARVTGNSSWKETIFPNSTRFPRIPARPATWLPAHPEIVERLKKNFQTWKLG